jgi:hypothetical protein
MESLHSALVAVRGQSVRTEIDRLDHRRPATVVLHIILDRDMIAGARDVDEADFLSIGDHGHALVLRQSRSGTKTGQQGRCSQRRTQRGKRHQRRELR